MLPSAETIRRLETLIAFPTVSRESNLGLIEWVRADLAAYGIESRLTYGGERAKANLFATVGAADCRGGLILSGHTAVVPVDGQHWTTDPFKATVRDGSIYGRCERFLQTLICSADLALPDGTHGNSAGTVGERACR
jgi:acetylornithine deacetylase